MLKLGLIVLVVLAVAVAAYIRLAPSDPATWHEDPRLVARPKTPNFHLIRMVGGDAMPPMFQIPLRTLPRVSMTLPAAPGRSCWQGPWHRAT